MNNTPGRNNESRDNVKNVGFIDDFANDNIKTPQTIRNRNGSVVYTNPLEDEKKPKRKVTKMSRQRYRRQNAGIIVLSVFLALIAALSVFFIIRTRNDKPVGSDERTPDTTASASESDTSQQDTAAVSEKADVTEKYEGDSVTLSNDEVHKGNLILVNYKYEYVFPKEDILVSMFDKSANYSVSTTETYIQKEALDSFSSLINDLYEYSGCDDVIVVSAYRSVEKQKEIYQDRLDRYGSEYAAAYVADPGFSEHHTGLAMDLSIYADNGMTYDIENYSECEWFMQNYQNYGYILRYPDDKAGITSINYESWHYRYVGLPHSLIMATQNYCLEEYIDYLRGFTAEGKVLKFRSNGNEISDGTLGDTLSAGEYMIYFVPASSGDETLVTLPEGYSCTVSGNNVDGFIVTASK